MKQISLNKDRIVAVLVVFILIIAASIALYFIGLEIQKGFELRAKAVRLAEDHYFDINKCTVQNNILYCYDTKSSDKYSTYYHRHYTETRTRRQNFNLITDEVSKVEEGVWVDKSVMDQ